MMHICALCVTPDPNLPHTISATPQKATCLIQQPKRQDVNNTKGYVPNIYVIAYGLRTLIRVAQRRAFTIVRAVWMGILGIRAGHVPVALAT